MRAAVEQRLEGRADRHEAEAGTGAQGETRRPPLLASLGRQVPRVKPATARPAGAAARPSTPATPADRSPAPSPRRRPDRAQAAEPGCEPGQGRIGSPAGNHPRPAWAPLPIPPRRTARPSRKLWYGGIALPRCGRGAVGSPFSCTPCDQLRHERLHAGPHVCCIDRLGVIGCNHSAGRAVLTHVRPEPTREVLDEQRGRRSRRTAGWSPVVSGHPRRRGRRRRSRCAGRPTSRCGSPPRWRSGGGPGVAASTPVLGGTSPWLPSPGTRSGGRRGGDPTRLAGRAAPAV